MSIANNEAAIWRSDPRIRMNHIFWLLAALNIIILLAAVISSIGTMGPHAAGSEMYIAFFIVAPALAACLLVIFSLAAPSLPWHLLALFGMMMPGLVVIFSKFRPVDLGRPLEYSNTGSEYFRTRALQQLGVCVVRLDAEAIRRTPKGVNVNVVGKGGMTLLALAVLELEAAGQAKAAHALATVQALLALGANPSSGLEAATKLKNSSILHELLAAGGDPNSSLIDGQPLAFKWLGMMPLESLRLLSEHGLNLNATAFGQSLILTAALKRRWDLVAYLIARGADANRPGPDGRRVLDAVNIQVAREIDGRAALASGLFQVQALLLTKTSTGSASCTPASIA
jgi:hypothetical protein